MMRTRPKPPKTLAEANRLLEEAWDHIEELQEQLQSQTDSFAALQRDLALVKRSLFGNRRERFEDDRQQYLFETLVIGGADPAEEPPEAHEVDDQDQQDETCPDEGGKKRKSRGRQTRIFPETFPREKLLQQLPDDVVSEEERANGRCFEKLVDERAELRPPEVVIVQEFVEVLAVDNDDATESKLYEAPRQPRIISSFAGDSLLAGLAVQRFSDHLPYYRLEEILLRSQLEIHRATQSRWMDRLAVKLRPLTELMRKLVLQCPVIQADETPVAKLEPGLGTTSKSYLWAVLGTLPHPYITFSYTDDRSKSGPDEFFAEFTGTLVADAYVCYERLNKTTLGRIELAGCHVHARRKFEAIHKLGETKGTRRAMSFFQQLFDFEEQWADLSADQRLTQRQQYSRPLVDGFKEWLDEQDSTLLPKHAMREAVNYMHRRWDNFTRFLEDGLVPAHNNASEQAVKLPVIGKKNWLFFGSSRSGQTAATFFTLTATCRLLKINPLMYLTDLFERLPTVNSNDEAALAPLLPDRWLAEHPAAMLKQRAEESATKAKLRRKRRKDLRKRQAAKT